MTAYHNNCCSCAVPSYQCLGEMCKLRHTKHLYCDECGDEADKLYIVGDGEYCGACALGKLEVVE